MALGPQSIQGQPPTGGDFPRYHPWRPHATSRASPILAGTGSFHLPDKEFRYLRTVIVTAAVYWGFNSGREPFLLTFQHRAGVSPYTSAYALAGTCVFSKQSLGPFLCGPHWLQAYALHLQRLPFSRSYGDNLPSSLTTVLSIALESSSCLPVSVCGTDTGGSTLRGFS